MSKDVKNESKSRLFPNNTEINTDSSEKSSTNSVQSPKSSFPSFSKAITKINDESDGSNSGFSDRSRDHHYISKVQPKFVPCSFKPIESNETIIPDENVEYSFKLGKETFVQKICLLTKSNKKNSISSDSTGENIPLEIIPLVDLPTSQANEQTPDNISIDVNRKDVKSASVKSFAGPRMTTSDSFISINKKHFEDIGKKLTLPSGTQIQACQKPCFSEKSIVMTIQNKPTIQSEQTSSSTPVSLFENDQYKTFTDSNSHDENLIDSIKSGSSQNKSATGKVEFKKPIELKNSSLLSIPSTVCRICHTNTANERLLSPCYCKGSLAYVHLSCLERWLNQSSRSYCELCLYQYNAVETLRYGFFEGIRMWVRHPRNRNHVRSDCLIAFLLTLVTLGLVVICFIGMDYFMIEGIKLGLSKMWTKSFIVSFLSVVMMGYFVTMYLIAKDQFVPWYTWWKNTLNIRLLLSPTVMQTQRI